MTMSSIQIALQVVEYAVQRIRTEQLLQILSCVIVIHSSDLISSDLSAVIPSVMSRLLGLFTNKSKSYAPKPIGSTMQDFSEVRRKTRQYESLMDDRKASIADENEVYMLETHGYDKLRFLSKSFIKRNKLLKKK